MHFHVITICDLDIWPICPFKQVMASIYSWLPYGKLYNFLTTLLPGSRQCNTTNLTCLILSQQVKFSELQLDMFRMLQTLEREPQEDLSNQIYDASPAPGRPPFVSGIIIQLDLWFFTLPQKKKLE